jgi:hypothetical protein
MHLIGILGLLVAAYGSIIFLVIAFRESVLWGILCLLPFFPVVFLLSHWDEAKKPFLVSVGGWVVFMGTHYGFLAG